QHAHQSNIPPTIDQAHSLLDKRMTQSLCHVGKSWVVPETGAAENTNISHGKGYLFSDNRNVSDVYKKSWFTLNQEKRRTNKMPESFN
ncbi:MAG: hypothetical protein KC587_17440, partial [Nitrospira sp.]|nr:hypothetical protein [Nitrospira sp.]